MIIHSPAFRIPLAKEQRDVIYGSHGVLFNVLRLRKLFRIKNLFFLSERSIRGHSVKRITLLRTTCAWVDTGCY